MATRYNLSKSTSRPLVLFRNE